MNSHVLTMAKTDTKVTNQVLTNILHCSVDHEMVLRAQELAPSGIMLKILSLKVSIYKQSKAFKLLAPKGSGQALKNYFKVKIPTCNLPLFLILQTYVYYHCPKSTEMTSSP